MKIKVSHIIWDINVDEDDVELPTEIVYDCDDKVSEKDISASIADLVSDDYGYCVDSLDYELIKS